MIKIGGKVNKPNTYNVFSIHISFFIQGRTSSDFFFSFFYNLAIAEVDKIMMKI